MMSDSAKGGINPEVRKTSLDYPHIKTHTINGFSSNPFDGSGDNIKVYHVCWKSFKKIGFVTTMFQDGKVYIFIFPITEVESYGIRLCRE